MRSFSVAWRSPCHSNMSQRDPGLIVISCLSILCRSQHVHIEVLGLHSHLFGHYVIFFHVYHTNMSYMDPDRIYLLVRSSLWLVVSFAVPVRSECSARSQCLSRVAPMQVFQSSVRCMRTTGTATSRRRQMAAFIHHMVWWQWTSNEPYSM